MNDKAQLFLAFAEQSLCAPVKRKLRTQEKQQMHRAQKKAMLKALNDRDLLMRLWKRWRQDVRNTALEGPYQKAIQTLINFLNQMSLKDTPRLLALVKTGHWQQTPADIRFLAISLIDAKLTTLREKQKLPPFDDAIMGKPLTLFQQVRLIIMGY